MIHQLKMKLAKFITTILSLCLLSGSCSPEIDIQKYFDLNKNEIITIRQFDEEVNSIEPSLFAIVVEGSKNFEIISKLVLEIKDWSENIVSITRPEMILSGVDFDLLIFGNFMVFRNSEGRELFSSSSVLKNLRDINLGGKDYEFEGFYGRGELIRDSWIFCSTVPIYNNYEYRKGYWQIWDENHLLLGEGNFLLKEHVLLKESSCGEVRIKYDLIDTLHWHNYYEGNEPLDSIYKKIAMSETRKFWALPFSE